MKINGILWLEDVVEKLLLKHNVEEHEVLEVFDNRPFFIFVEKGHRKNENVYAALGQTESGRYLIVFFIYKKIIRLLSFRREFGERYGFI